MAECKFEFFWSYLPCIFIATKCGNTSRMHMGTQHGLNDLAILFFTGGRG